MNLVRVDYTLVGLTDSHCMKLLPTATPKSAQKVVIGDQNGTVQEFYFKKGEIQQVFKTLPGPPISRIALGGALGSIQDKIFVAAKNEVRGYSKKGKLFLNFDTNRTEDIKHMFISGSDLLVAGDHVLNHYNDCKEVAEFMCSDGIMDIIGLYGGKGSPLSVLIGSKASELLVLDKSALSCKYSLPSPPTVFHLFNNDGGPTKNLITVGFQDGQIALYQVPLGGPLVTKWILQNEKERGEVSCIHFYNITNEETPDLIVGRQDGSIEVYSIPEQDDLINLAPFPVEKFSYVCNESILSVQGGVVGNAGFDEILVTTHTGWLFGLTTEVVDKQTVGPNETSSSHIGVSQKEKLKVARLRAEIDEIEGKVAKEREKYQNLTQADSDGLSTIPPLSIRDKLTFCKEDTSYQLTLEVETTIDNVLVQADLPIELMDIDKNSAVVSHSACDAESGNYVLATYRCQINTTRLELRFKTTEGQSGMMRVYITPLVHPKCCSVRQYHIKPLSHHARIHNHETLREYHALSLKGTFSLLEIHSWISQCLPEVPEKLPVEDKISYVFQSVSVGTVLFCEFRRGEAEFKSNNVSTIAIIKDVITKEATAKRIKLEISCSVMENCMRETLRLIFPLLEETASLTKQKELLAALKDMEAGGPEFTPECLTKKYRAIVNNQKEITEKINKNPDLLPKLTGILQNLHRDWVKLRGMSSSAALNLNDMLASNMNIEFLFNLFCV
nr:PREDICTED: Bardet-Biedl syndrome 7 protein homolog [Bemisia tabaci]